MGVVCYVKCYIITVLKKYFVKVNVFCVFFRIFGLIFLIYRRVRLENRNNIPMSRPEKNRSYVARKYLCFRSNSDLTTSLTLTRKENPEKHRSSLLNFRRKRNRARERCPNIFSNMYGNRSVFPKNKICIIEKEKLGTFAPVTYPSSDFPRIARLLLFYVETSRAVPRNIFE